MGNGYEISLNILNEYFNFKFYKFKTERKFLIGQFQRNGN